MTFVQPPMDEVMSAPRPQLDAACRSHVPGEGLEARSLPQLRHVRHLLLPPLLQTILRLQFV